MPLIKLFCLLFFLSFYSQGISQENRTKPEKTEVVGFHLDLRIQVMKPEALKDFANKLSSQGVNTLIMEWEATFPFESHPLIPNQYAYSKEEITAFITYCKELGIEVIPIQQTLGHLEYVLRHDRYVDQREDYMDVSQICPMESQLNKTLFTDLLSEIAAIHPSKYIHIGGDEAFLFGSCDKCKAKIAKEGKSALLADHLKMLCDIVLSLGKTPIIWSDVATEYPDELSKLPKETIFIEWNYGWALDRFGSSDALVERGFEVWGAPALRSGPDNYFIVDWEKHMNNIRDFIPVSRKRGYNGIVMTSWSTSGAYSTVIEDIYSITDLIPVRNVYPISGFNILLEAYAQAMKINKPLDVDRFIVEYGRSQFGFNKKESMRFWKALKGFAYEVAYGKVKDHKELSVEMLRDSIRKNKETLDMLQPKRNIEEFEHYRLMKHIRENYLSFECIELYVNSKAFKSEQSKKVMDSIQILIDKDTEISKKFTALNRNLLYPDEIKKENALRTLRMRFLYDRLAKSRN